MNRYMETNRQYWDEVVPIHAKSSFYDVEGFKAGRSTLDRIERETVGEVKGKSLLHLQCHFGLDTLSWARLGAKVTGVDFSSKAIETARALGKELDISATFVCSDILSLGDQIADRFDIVYTSHGVLTWLADLRPWAELIAGLLVEGGRFALIESHPFAAVFDDEQLSDLTVCRPYFAREPTRYDEPGSYAEPEAQLRHTVTYEWIHPLSEVLNALIASGLVIEELKEFPFTGWQMLPFMIQDEEGFWRLPDQDDLLPFMLSLRAGKRS